MRRIQLLDAQQALAFVTPQFYNIETGIYEVRYPSFEYEQLVPVITEGSEWARGTMFYSMDSAGEARFISGGGFDMPLADVSKSQFSTGFHMAGIGYEWNLEEISVAALEGINMSDAKARAARKAAQQFNWAIALRGIAEKGWTGLFNNASVTAGNVAANGTGSVTTWTAKTPDNILADINGGLTGIHTNSLETEMADTVLLPTAAVQYIANTPRSANSDTTILAFLRENNVYTQETGRPLTSRGIRSLANAGAAGVGRMVIYRRDPEVVRYHLPMPHRFLPPFQKGSMVWEVGGIMRTGGTEVRIPSAIRYLDGITPAP